MKKIIKSMIALVFLIMPCMIAFSACSTDIDTELIQCNLNGGSFTEEYKQENGITSNNLIKMVNLDYYGGFSDGLPCEEDLVAPTGKVFAGWYIDKSCSPDSYLTSETWTDFSAGIKDETGDNVIYARWIDAGTKDILYQVVNNEVVFGADFIAENTRKGNMTNTTVVRFNVSAESFDKQKNSLPDVDDVVYDSVNNEFNGWKVENNGHYYDFVNKKHDENASNNMNSYVNANFDSVNFVHFFADGNEKVAYVLLRPKNITNKPWNEIKIELDINVAGYDFNDYNNQVNNARQTVGHFICTPDSKNRKEKWENDNVTTYYANLELEIRYDMSFENVKKLIPNITILDGTSQFDGWSFVIGENKYTFDETNWNNYAKVDPRPNAEYREIKLELKTK